MPHRLLLDTSSLMYRAFHALPDTIRGEDGKPVNAVFGYLDMAARLQDTFHPDSTTHACDHTIAPEERVRAFPGYKAQRAPDPAGLPEQFDLLEEVLDAFGAERALAPGWEADDVIGTLCAGAGAGDEIEIVTGDRDLFQLVRDDSPTVRVLFTVKGVSELARYDEAAVSARYGIPPSRYVDFATLRGDPSDGLPGVRGVGEKTARALVCTYESLDVLLDSAADLPKRLAAQIREASGYLRAMREVVPVRRDVSVSMFRNEPAPDRLVRLARERRLQGPLRRLAAALGLELPPME
jgi:5'-3' exonuclease